MMTDKHISTDTVKVWDPLVRIFHWSLVVTFFLAFMTEGDWINLHVDAGYIVSGLIGFRLIWGVIGTRYARFSQFFKSPGEVLDYLRKMREFNVPHYLGHNPAAAAMIFALLLSIIAISVTGMSIIATEGQGPLAGTFVASLNAGWMKDIHAFFANFTMLLVIMHVAGVIFSSMLEWDNLPRAMLTGRKKFKTDAVDIIEGELS